MKHDTVTKTLWHWSRVCMLLACLLVMGCETHDHHDGGHYDHGHDHGEHDHHDDGHHNDHSGLENGAPDLSYTVASENIELFVEFAALVANQESSFAAHFTFVDGHRAVTSGRVEVALDSLNSPTKVVAESPSSPGIFRPALTPTFARSTSLYFFIETEGLRDTIVVPDVAVFPTVEIAKHEAERNMPEDGAITFLLEQAWKVDFQTYKVDSGYVYDLVETYGTWKTDPMGNTKIVAPNSGIVVFSQPDLLPGRYVTMNETLLAIRDSENAPEGLATSIRVKQSELLQLEKEYQRKEQLLQEDIIAQSEFEIVQQQYTQVKAEYAALSKNYQDGAKKVPATSSGLLRAVYVQNGDYVEAGTPLCVIGKKNSNTLEVFVSQNQYASIQPIENVLYTTREGQWSDMQSDDGSIVAVNTSVTAEQPLMTVTLRTTPSTEIPTGMSARVQLVSNGHVSATMLPEAALIEHFGEYSVVVQRTGESYDIVPIHIGRRTGSHVEVLEGLQHGDVVVTQGRHLVKMASQSGQVPAHGHAH